MIEEVYITGTGLLTPFGKGTSINFSAIAEGRTAIQHFSADHRSPIPYVASCVEQPMLKKKFDRFNTPMTYTKLEQMMLLAISDAMLDLKTPITEKTALIVATTKGNIDLLNSEDMDAKEGVYLSKLAQKLADHLNLATIPIVVSNACVSGIMAISVAKRLMMSGAFENAIVVAGDLVSRFTLTGFQSFQALSASPCTPYSLHRKGITLGEGAAAVILSKQKPKGTAFQVAGSASANDANHISGPSRTGEGLFLSVERALAASKLSPSQIDFISAHGTATLYNDEMEAIAFHRARLQHVPLHSLKGVYGHTLGASGLIETVLGIEMMKRNQTLPTVGFGSLGVSKALNIAQSAEPLAMDTLLKTASGFGGCNTAVVFKKVS